MHWCRIFGCTLYISAEHTMNISEDWETYQNSTFISSDWIIATQMCNFYWFMKNKQNYSRKSMQSNVSHCPCIPFWFWWWKVKFKGWMQENSNCYEMKKRTTLFPIHSLNGLQWIAVRFVKKKYNYMFIKGL